MHHLAERMLIASTVFKNQNACVIPVPLEILIMAVVYKRNLIVPLHCVERMLIATRVLMLSNAFARLALLAIRTLNVSVSRNHLKFCVNH